MNARHMLPLLVAAALAAHCPAARADDSKKAAPAPASVASSAAPRLRYRIAVDQFKWNEIRDEQWTLPVDIREGIQSQLVDKLQKSGYFIVMEREATAQQQMSQEDQIAAIKAGNLPVTPAVPLPARQQRTGANYIVTPSVVGFGVTSGKKGGFSLGGINLGNAKTTATVTINIRISDAQTSEMLDSQTALGNCEAKSNGFSLQGLYTTEQFQASPAGQAVDLALDDAVAKIVARISKEPWTALVAAQDKTTNRVIINAGNLSGVTLGQVFDVYRAGQPILDPDTGDVISHGDEVKVGRISIVRVDRSASYADVLEGKDFLPRDIVKATN